jgi:hypothetical protein
MKHEILNVALILKASRTTQAVSDFRAANYQCSTTDTKKVTVSKPQSPADLRCAKDLIMRHIKEIDISYI